MSTARLGRPKTDVGHRDDAALDLLEARALLGDLHEHRRYTIGRERDLMARIEALLVGADASWRKAREASA